MAEEVRYVEHPTANVSRMADAVNAMQAQVVHLSDEVVQVNNQVESIQGTFQEFLNQFRTFVEQDRKQRRLHEALEDRVILQDTLNTKFGRHQRVRHFVKGILQATDSSLVAKETISESTEELMLAVPHYWLVPALVALAAWINDDRDLAERALREAMVRDDEKTSLLFALICRRASRNQACNTWLHRYFAMQDPMNIERKLIIVLDAYANGLFGADSHGLCATQIGDWIAEMEDTVGFRENQVARWETAIEGKVTNKSHKNYPYLEKYSKDWPLICKALNNAGLHKEMHEYVSNVFEQPLGETQDLKNQLDELLESLVSNYDSEELPYREQFHYAELVIESKGDTVEADRKFASASTAFEERSDLTQLLTNAAMNPELVHASPATQKLSMAISRDWLIEAYNNVTVKNRNSIIGDINFEIEGFNGSTMDGSNEEELCHALDRHFTTIKDGRIAEVKQSPMDYFLVGAGVLALILGFAGVFPWFVGIIALGLAILKFFAGKKKVEKDIENLKTSFAKMIDDGKKIVSALCAETIDFRRELNELEQDYEPLMQYLDDIAPEQFVRNNNQRRIAV